MADQIVARLAEFPEGERVIVQHGRLQIGVFHLGGRYYALPNVCAHQFGPVCTGTITGTLISSKETQWRPAWVREGEILVCPWHALEFDITTGQCLAHPKVKLRHYSVRLEDGQVIVSL
jgi:nitrite reductase (NADH) small subunit